MLLSKYLTSLYILLVDTKVINFKVSRVCQIAIRQKNSGFRQTTRAKIFKTLFHIFASVCFYFLKKCRSMWLVALLLLNYQDVHSSYFREQNPIKLSSYKEKNSASCLAIMDCHTKPRAESGHRLMSCQGTTFVFVDLS